MPADVLFQRVDNQLEHGLNGLRKELRDVCCSDAGSVDGPYLVNPLLTKLRIQLRNGGKFPNNLFSSLNRSREMSVG